MNDYISRETAVALAMEYCTDDDGSCPKAGHDLRELLDDLENAPPANVRPVVRGHWIFDRGDLATCSNCGSEILKRDVRNHNFCHYCGADLRKRSVDTDAD